MPQPLGDEIGKPGALIALQAVAEVGEGVDYLAFALPHRLVALG